MLAIRFNRVGKKNQAAFRVVLQEKTQAPGRRHVEVLGSWNPHTKETVLKNDRILHWIGQGAEVSDSVHNLLVRQGVVDDGKRAIKMKRPEPKVEEAPVAEEAKPVAAVEVPVEADPKAEEAKAAEEAPVAAEDTPATEITESAPSKEAAEVKKS